MESPLAILLAILGFITQSLSQAPAPAPDSTPGPKINTTAISDKLTLDFYKSTCPNVEQIISDTIRDKSKQNQGIIPGIIRLHFHDCYISGCDASILLTPQRYTAYDSEMAHPANGKSLRGMDALDAAKAEIEKQCPGVVSCADILAYAARDAIVISGNPKYEVPAGRRDSLLKSGAIAADLPKGNDSVSFLQEKFAERGLTLGDMVVLEGSHSIGQTRCVGTIADVGSMDKLPDTAKFVDKQFLQMVKQKLCPESEQAAFTTITAPLVPDNPNISAWGNSFYDQIMKGKSLLPFDDSLAVETTTKDLVQRYASNRTEWQIMFNDAMIKLGKVNVLTGDQGEIRRNCGWINAVVCTA